MHAPAICTKAPTYSNSKGLHNQSPFTLMEQDEKLKQYELNLQVLHICHTAGKNSIGM